MSLQVDATTDFRSNAMMQTPLQMDQSLAYRSALSALSDHASTALPKFSRKNFNDFYREKFGKNVVFTGGSLRDAATEARKKGKLLLIAIYDEDIRNFSLLPPVLSCNAPRNSSNSLSF